MKTSVFIDDKKLALAKRLSHVTTLRKVVDQALDAYIAQVRRQSMLELLESGFFKGSLNIMRERRGRLHR